MNKTILCLSLVFAASAQAALTAATRAPFSNDTLTKYQWALQASDHKILRDDTDIRSQEVSAIPGHSADVQASNDGFASVMKKNIVVAVLDSGVEVQHADLAASLYHNDKECLNGGIPFKPDADKDGNGYKGDCIGWNFMAAPGAPNENNPDDDLGHGTHVAGIIAAQINNKTGVAGITNRVRILPLKVTGSADTNATNASLSASTALTSRVIKALRYAIEKRVDVINISMGWPAATDSVELRQTFAQAQQAGIVIVAAAGNNNNNSFNFPCSYPGVLCVAATGIDNTLTGFSNYGGQVDISAPGEEILSTYPNAKSPVNFSVKGYELLNGTSQAAPFVSAAVAVLKGAYPGITADEIKARLFAAAQDLEKGKFTLFGTLKIQSALNMSARPVVAPDFKGLSRALFNSSEGIVQINLPIKNYWEAADAVSVTVQSLSSNFALQSGSSQTLSLMAGEQKNLTLTARIQDQSASSSVKIRVTVQTAAGTRSFVHEFELSRSLKNDAAVTRLPIRLLPGTLPSVIKTAMTVNDVAGISDSPDYYFWESKEGQLQLSVLQMQGASYQQRHIELPSGTKNILSFMKVPLANGVQGYWIGTMGLAADGKTKTMTYILVAEDLVSLRRVITFSPETVVMDKDAVTSLQFALQSSSGLVPVFTTIGKIPKADLNPDGFQFENNSPQRRVFYLKAVQTNGAWTYQTRNFDNYQFNEGVRAALGLNYQQDLRLITMLPQSVNSLERIRLLYAYGSQDLKRFVVVETRGEWLDQHKFELRPMDYSSSMMASGVPAPVTDLTDNIAVKNSAVSFGVFLTPIKAQNLFFDVNARLQGEFTLQSSTTKDLLISLVQNFRRGAEYFTFAQSKSNLIMQVNNTNGSVRRYESSIHRATWPGISSTELLFPAVVQNGSRLSPAIYVDATQMYSNHIYFWTESDEGKLVAPAKLNLDVPSECRALTPQKFTDYRNKNFAVLMCAGNANAELRILPLNF